MYSWVWPFSSFFEFMWLFYIIWEWWGFSWFNWFPVLHVIFRIVKWERTGGVLVKTKKVERNCSLCGKVYRKWVFFSWNTENRWEKFHKELAKLAPLAILCSIKIAFLKSLLLIKFLVTSEFSHPCWQSIFVCTNKTGVLGLI